MNGSHQLISAAPRIPGLELWNPNLLINQCVFLSLALQVRKVAHSRSIVVKHQYVVVGPANGYSVFSGKEKKRNWMGKVTRDLQCPISQRRFLTTWSCKTSWFKYQTLMNMLGSPQVKVSNKADSRGEKEKGEWMRKFHTCFNIRAYTPDSFVWDHS